MDVSDKSVADEMVKITGQMGVPVLDIIAAGEGAKAALSAFRYLAKRN